MKKTPYSIHLTLAASLLLMAHALAAPLKIGDRAPALQAGIWLQGEAVASLQAGNVYVLEFWATWGGRYKEIVPKLNALHTKFKDRKVIVIGQNVLERDEARAESFIKAMGTQMTYRVALDAKADENDRGAMCRTWLDAAGFKGVPVTFVVDARGNIAWMGHPSELTEHMLEEVLAGRFDPQKAQEEKNARQQKQGQLAQASERFQAALAGDKADEAEKALKELEQLLPAEQRKQTRGGWFYVYLKKKDYPAAYKVAAELSEADLGNANAQNQLAYTILADPGIEKRDLKLAETIARRGVKASQEKDGNILDTLARALFMQDKKAEAINVQEQALTVAEDSMKATIQETLDSYRKGVLPPAN